MDSMKWKDILTWGLLLYIILQENKESSCGCAGSGNQTLSGQPCGANFNYDYNFTPWLRRGACQPFIIQGQ